VVRAVEEDDDTRGAIRCGMAFVTHGQASALVDAALLQMLRMPPTGSEVV